jgi:ABC-type multidrug transport system fused ATPase/permease subunit
MKIAMNHWFLVFVGILAAMVQGSILPFYGVFLSKMLFVLNHPERIYIASSQDEPSLEESLMPPYYFYYDKRGESDKWCLYMMIAALSALIASFLKRMSFGIVGEHVTHRLRLDLYRKILYQGKSWLDLTSPSKLISVISNDA